jgi:hypothetical protein
MGKAKFHSEFCSKKSLPDLHQTAFGSESKRERERERERDKGREK